MSTSVDKEVFKVFRILEGMFVLTIQTLLPKVNPIHLGYLYVF
jgi:hypothetical protein